LWLSTTGVIGVDELVISTSLEVDLCSLAGLLILGEFWKEDD